MGCDARGGEGGDGSGGEFRGWGVPWSRSSVVVLWCGVDFRGVGGGGASVRSGAQVAVARAL